MKVAYLKVQITVGLIIYFNLWKENAMAERLKDKVAVITGAGSGQGRAAVEIFAREGARIIIAEWIEKSGKETEREMLEKGYDVLFIQTDVSDEESVQNMTIKALEKYGRIDILFNNAGIGYSYRSRYYMGDLVDTPLKDWNEANSINLNGCFLCCKHILPIMRKQMSGSIVNNSSMNGLVGETGADSYTAAKGGIIALTRVMAKDNAKYNIRVNCTCPGGIVTPMIQPALDADPSLREHLSAGVPLGRLGRAEEVANAALFFASDEASYITGAILPVDGGWYAV